MGLRIKTADPNAVARALQEFVTPDRKADRIEARGATPLDATMAAASRTFEIALPAQDYPALLDHLHSLGEVESLPAKRSAQASSAAPKAGPAAAPQTNLLIHVEVVPR